MQRISSAFYAEFHPIQGPRVFHEYPTGFFMAEGISGIVAPNSAGAGSPVAGKQTRLDFEAVSDFIIPKKELCGKAIEILLENRWLIIGCPVLIEDPKYERNYFLFNVGLVLDAKLPVNSNPYVAIVEKLASVLKQMELESEFLYQQQQSPQTSAVPVILRQLVTDLNQFQECHIPINDCNTLHLKLMHHPQSVVSTHLSSHSAKIHDYEVPVLLFDVSRNVTNQWDLSILRLLPHINGIDSVKQLAVTADMDLTICRQAIFHLLHHSCIAMVDRFHTNNVYKCNRNIMDRALQKLILPQIAQLITVPGSTHLPSVDELSFIYSNIQRGVTIGNIWASTITQIPHFASIDLRRLVVYGQIYGLLKRVHRYPIIISGNSKLPKTVQRWIDGSRHIDELASHLNYPVEELEEALLTDPAVQILQQ